MRTITIDYDNQGKTLEYSHGSAEDNAEQLKNDLVPIYVEFLEEIFTEAFKVLDEEDEDFPILPDYSVSGLQKTKPETAPESYHFASNGQGKENEITNTENHLAFEAGTSGSDYFPTPQNHSGSEEIMSSPTTELTQPSLFQQGDFPNNAGDANTSFYAAQQTYSENATTSIPSEEVDAANNNLNAAQGVSDSTTSTTSSSGATFAENPIMNSDMLGGGLDIADNDASRNDIKSLVMPKNEKYITFIGNRVGLDFGDLGADAQAALLNSDEGLNLINDMITSNQKMLYEASELAMCHYEDGNRITKNLLDTRNQLINASTKGKDSDGTYTYLPKGKYQGQVVINPNATFREADLDGAWVTKTRASVVFHELAENYERTHNGVDYKGADGAHNRAINREKRWHGKSYRPGAAEASAVEPSKERKKELYEKRLNYLRYGD